MPAKLALSSLLVLALAACGGVDARPPAQALLHASPVAAQTQWVDTHGIEVAVPAAWRLGRGMCGTPKANTVLWNNGAILACLTSQPAGLSVVEFEGVLKRSARWYDRHTARVNIDGAEAFRWNAGIVAGSHDVQLIFPHRRVTVSVMSPDRGLLRQMLSSVRTVNVNEVGCPTRPHPSYRLGSRRDSAKRFVPARAVRLVGCYYDNGWLDRSSRVGSHGARQVAEVLNHASWGSSTAPRNSIAGSECAPSWHTFSIAYFQYAHRAPVAVTAHLDGCTHLGASNGKWVVRMSHAWVPTFWRNVAYYGSVADVWGCGC